MNRPANISSVQLVLLAVGSALMFPYTFMPVIVTPPANQDSWIIEFIAIFYMFLLCLPLLILIRQFKGTNINSTVENIMGKFMGKIILCLFSAFFIFCFTSCMAMAIIFISSSIFPETPSWGLLLYIVVPVTYTAIKGAGTLGRISTLIVPYIILTILFFFIFGAKDMDFSILQPVLSDSSFVKLNQGAFLTAARVSEIFIFFVFSEFLKKDVNLLKTFTWGLVLFIVLSVLITIPTVTVLGIDIAKHAWNPYFLFTKQIKAYDFIQRVESLSTLGWFLGVLLKLSLFNFMASHVLSGVVKTKSHAGFSVGISVFSSIIVLLPIINNSNTIIFLRSDQIFPWIVLFFVFIIPFLIVLVYFIRKRFGKLSPQYIKPKED